jgi:hypothetical protein
MPNDVDEAVTRCLQWHRRTVAEPVTAELHGLLADVRCLVDRCDRIAQAARAAVGLSLPGSPAAVTYRHILARTAQARAGILAVCRAAELIPGE